MSKDDIKAAIEAKKALMAAEKRSTEKRGRIVPSYLGGARDNFEELSKFNKSVSGKRYASDAAINKLGRS